MEGILYKRAGDKPSSMISSPPRIRWRDDHIYSLDKALLPDTPLQQRLPLVSEF
jgi:hypothetical protein